ncbi:Carbohydrate-binding-like protein [Neofusicoccum parvum]|uniref:Carbohydrate-binding-like protein n=1 Tax=Neofusicoccum parvum TaxID=310453 RepID=A0ACB5S2P0_9PEZI|nr:Carbohydrate-binding-like protein [Neofusicoccum parvum]
MAQVKTYLLAPTFAFRPTGPIALGTIIADPFAPHRALTTADPGAPSPPIDTVVELDRSIHRSTSRAARLSLWAQFLASLLEIGLKGWREKTVRVNEFRSKACFLGDEEEEEEESDVEVETSAATAESLLKPGRKDVVLEASEVQDGEERCICIAARST